MSDAVYRTNETLVFFEGPLIAILASGTPLWTHVFLCTSMPLGKALGRAVTTNKRNKALTQLCVDTEHWAAVKLGRD